MQTLAKSLALKNQTTRDWVAIDPENRFAGILSEDLAHWASYGITTAEELEKYLLACDVYESTKSLHGYKPSWAGLMMLSIAELNAQAESLSREANSMQAYWDECDRLAMEEEQKERDEQEKAEAKAFTREEWTVGMAFAQAGL